MAEKTIIYYTDNSLDESFANKIRAHLKKAAGGMPIISVSQKPIDFGHNFCVGEVGRSHLSMFRQLLMGAKLARTKYIVLVEHDCLYTPEHFAWMPPKDDTFYYNVNHWYVQWNNKLAGQYSWWRRKAMSQLICNRQSFIEAIKDKIWMLENGHIIRRGKPGACEPGVCDNRDAFKVALAKMKDLGKDGKKWKAEGFRTKLPNLDIRHGGNFSGVRRGRYRRYSLPYWGSFHRVMGEVPPGTWYQNVIDDVPQRNPRSKNSKFYNEGKWRNFIEPLLPYTDGTLVEMGCNAGLYLKMAKNTGFSKVIGVEGDLDYLRQATYYLDGQDVGLLRKTVGEDFRFKQIPIADVTLLANFHYWLTPEVLKEYLWNLVNKTIYCIVVSRKNTNRRHKLDSSLDSLREYFNGWDEIKVISNLSLRNDPTPKKLYSVLFKNPKLDRYSIEDNKKTHRRLWQSRKFLPSYSKLAKQLWNGNQVKLEETEFYDYCIWRGIKKRRGEKFLMKKVSHWAELALSVKENGIRDPLTINEKGILKDGDHRAILADMLGYKYLICRKEQ